MPVALLTSPPMDETPALPDLEPRPGKQTGADVRLLVGLMQRLLAPDGCPWDREQTLETLIPYLVEETYEVVDAVASGSVADHREELGDLLLQVVFQAELRHAQGAFGIDDVARGIVGKLVSRHPHVFGEVKAENADQALASWARLKAEEKKKKGKKGALDGIPRSAPALLRASRAGEKASAVGFDWPDATGPRRKIDEELAELDQAIVLGDKQKISDELGDTLQALVNLARKLGVDAEGALRASTDRFASRFAHIEDALAAQGRAVRDASAAEQDRLWEEAKRVEAQSPSKARISGE
jgi:tetrapyrrole methylase family protein/MazG family protein